MGEGAGALKGWVLAAGRGLDSGEACARLPVTGGRWGWGPAGAGGLGGEDADGAKASSFEGCCCISVTVADYANSDPAVVRSGRVKKAVANAVQQEGRLPTSLSDSGREGRTRCFISWNSASVFFLQNPLGILP